MLKNVNRDALAARLRERYAAMGEQWSQKYADHILLNTRPELERSVIEWAEGRPLSDIRFPAEDGGEYGVVQVMRRRNNDDFVGALQVMNLFFEDEAKAIAKIDLRVL